MTPFTVQYIFLEQLSDQVSKKLSTLNWFHPPDVASQESGLYLPGWKTHLTIMEELIRDPIAQGDLRF